MTCSCIPPDRTSGAGRYFTKHSRRYFRNFVRKGLAKEQQYLVDGITSHSLEGKSLLEIGCGVGGLHLTLLQRGAATAVGIDAAEGMIEKARTLAQSRSLSGRTTYMVGDFVALENQISEADVTVLDKVVCCYENIQDLVTKSLGKTRGVYALSFPRPHPLVKFLFAIPIAAGRALRWSFRPYWHDWDSLLCSIREQGFRERYARSTLLWTVRVFQRSSSA